MLVMMMKMTILPEFTRKFRVINKQNEKKIETNKQHYSNKRKLHFIKPPNS
jgi:hypothetical protein